MIIIIGGIQGPLAQGQARIIHVPVQVATEGKPLTFEVTVEEAPQGVEKVTLFYRKPGQYVYDYLETFVGEQNRYIITLDGIYLTRNGLEYYLLVELKDGSEISFPEVAPATIPLEILVSPAEEVGALETPTVMIISPLEGETVTSEDLVIAVSLFDVADEIDISATKLLLDGRNVTPKAKVSLSLVSFVPDKITPGRHTAELQLRNKVGESLPSLKWSFRVKRGRREAEKVFVLKGSAFGDTRYEKIHGKGKSYIKGSLKMQGNYGWQNYRAKLFLTNQEKPDLQPRNRYAFGIMYPWVKLNLMDFNPKFSELILRGKRVRGVQSIVELGWFQLNAVYGETERNIEGKTELDTATTAAGEDSIFTKITKSGTFKRNLLGIRTAFGRGKKFRWGLSFLKAKDDVESIDFGTSPKDNLVLGSDLFIGLDNRRVIFESEVAFSLLNNNIAPGSFTKADLEDAGMDIPVDPSDYENIFVINTNIVPLNPMGLASLAYKMGFRFMQGGHNVALQYKHIGNAYNSLGNPYLLTDTEGYSLSDRMRLLNNRIYLTLSYDNYVDNLSEEEGKDITRRTSYLIQMAYYPQEPYLPNMNLSWRNFEMNNGVDSLLTDSLGNDIGDNRKKDITNNYSFTVSKPFDFMDIGHMASLSYMATGRRDAFERDPTITTKISSNNASRMYILSLRSDFRIPLKTDLSYAINRTEARGGETWLNYDILNLRGEYRVGRYQASGGFRLTIGKGKLDPAATSPDVKYNKYEFSLGGGLGLTPNVSLVLASNFVLFNDKTGTVTGDNNDILVKLRLEGRF